jgi:hypothetical protein
MKKIILLLVVFGSFLNAADFDKKPMAAYQKSGKWFVIDHSGKEIFSSPIIYELLGYSENAYRVRLNAADGNRTWAFLDDSGKAFMTPMTAIIFDFHNGLARSARHNPWAKDLQIIGYFDKNGNEVIKHEYDDAIDFSEGMAFVMNKDKRGYIDVTGKMVITLDSMAGNEFSEGLAAVNTTDFRVGYKDATGKTKIKFKYDEGMPFSEGKAAVYYKGKFGYINKSGAEIIMPLYDYANKFKENYAFVAMARDYVTYVPDWAFIDTNGRKITEFKYQGVNDFSEGLAAVKWGDKWGYIDYRDTVVIPNKFSFASPFVNGLAFVYDKENSKFGYINKTGEFLVILPQPEKLVDLRLNRRLK